MQYAAEHQIPLDFFSWHGYRYDPQDYVKDTEFAKDLLLRYGFTETETILNEWNYVRSWSGPEYNYSMHTIRDEKGAAFCAASMLAVQKAPLDMFMYYDARPATGWNGLFVTHTYELLPPYYAFWQFNKLYQLENEVASETDSELVYVGAAARDDKAAVQLAYFSDEDLAGETVAVTLKGLSDLVKVSAVLTDKDHENEKVRECLCNGPETTLYFNLKLHSTMLLTIERTEF